MNGIPARLELSRADDLVFVALVFFATLPRGRSTCRALDLGGLIGRLRILLPLPGAIIAARGTPLLVLVLTFVGVVLVVFVVFLVPRFALIAALLRPLRRRTTLIFRGVVLVVIFRVARFRRLRGHRCGRHENWSRNGNMIRFLPLSGVGALSF